MGIIPVSMHMPCTPERLRCATHINTINGNQSSFLNHLIDQCKRSGHWVAVHINLFSGYSLHEIVQLELKGLIQTDVIDEDTYVTATWGCAEVLDITNQE